MASISSFLPEIYITKHSHSSKSNAILYSQSLLHIRKMSSYMDHDFPRDGEAWWPVEHTKSFALSGKIMLSAVVILFAVIVLMLLLHVCARWYLLTVNRREIRRRRSARSNRRTHLVFYADNGTLGSVAVAINRGLEKSVLSSLPVFLYSSETKPELQECAVCLSEFEENEKGRLLPKCNHSFHIECIDMWFHSHSTCPLSRSPVEAFGVQTQTPENNLPEVVVDIGSEPGEPGSSSGSQNVVNDASSSLGLRRKGLDLIVMVQVPRRSESELSTPASHGFKYPSSRLLSFKRLLIMNRLIGAGTNSGSDRAESSDIEYEKDEWTQGILVHRLL